MKVNLLHFLYESTGHLRITDDGTKAEAKKHVSMKKFLQRHSTLQKC